MGYQNIKKDAKYTDFKRGCQLGLAYITRQSTSVMHCGRSLSPDLIGPCIRDTGRKLKRFGALKALGMTPSMMFQSHLAMSGDNQALTTMSCIPGIREVQFSPQILSILENIEPEVVYANYDSSQSVVPHLLLSSLNRLCEKQLLWIVKWSKSLPGNESGQLRVTKPCRYGDGLAGLGRSAGLYNDMN